MIYSKTDGGLDTREWEHRKIEGFKFSQQKNKGNKSWNSSVYRRKLVTVATSIKNPCAKHPKSQLRAKYILDKRDNKSKLPKPVCGMGFFPFEEQLKHHVDEGLSLASTGIGVSFFQNPYVRDYLQGLQPRHRPVYRLKLVRIIRCIIDVSQSEVCCVCFCS